ncbi:hypothetical protein DV736_g6254, partial [Chaetothyriales sp. CBS 134916]
MAGRKPQLTLYTDATPNGIKISIALEELGLPYKTEHIDISTNRQKEPWFLAINPNGRIPALTDTFGADGEVIRLFEGGSILQYLAEQYDAEKHKISFPRGSRESYECNNWLFFQHGGVGPMQGQANHFSRYAPEKIQYGIDRYINETRRLYRVLDTQLAESKSGFLFPHVKKWEEMMLAREGVSRGSNVPKKLMVKERLKDQKFQEDHAAKAREWIQRGMK